MTPKHVKNKLKNYDVYALKTDVQGRMYDYQSVVKPGSNTSIPGVTFRQLAGITLLYRCLESATSRWIVDIETEVLDLLEDFACDYPHVGKIAREELYMFLQE